jgi:hypothetical protein
MTGNYLLWLAWFCFGTFLVWLLWTRYRPLVLQVPELPKEAARPFPAWLFCEEGTTMDRRVQWFALRPGGVTVVGARPRANTAEREFVYLTADDIEEDHLLIRFDPESRRYAAETCGRALALHNNDPLAINAVAELADGDTLDLGRLSRFRFTLSGPEDA